MNMWEERFFYKWEKCHLMVKWGIVLGHCISNNGLNVDQDKVEGIIKLPPLTNVKEVISFLGYVGFFRRLIKYLSMIK